MGRAFGTVAGLLLVIVLLPTIAQVAQPAVPFLLSALLVLAIWRLAFPPWPRRR